MSQSFDYTVRPVEVWPGDVTPSWQRQRSPLKGSWARTLKELSRELQALGARNIIFRLDITDYDLRDDGQLRANARPKSPGVLLEFIAGRLKGAPRLVYRCDFYTYWQDNLLHIALGMEALRKVDRYHITSASEQYSGFKALPSATAPTMSVANAARVIANYTSFSTGVVLDSATNAKEAVRSAVFATHPDRNNGDRTAFDLVDTARKVLSSHHGVSL